MNNPMSRFATYIAEQGLKNTPQRRLIVEVFFESGKHLTTEELYAAVREKDKSIGQATVYRTLKILCRAGLAKEQNFGGQSACYEALDERKHHDHLICIACERNVEIVDAAIEAKQEEVAKRNGFVLTSHRMILYGLCPDCQMKRKSA
ncbi:MAG: transcriptional repressor [Desulfovibrio sp.]|jgi:Fur family ferric uptake transcriptional regulator|nr:transcriptional repressor [Desulfovibrio sp.]